MVDNYYLILGLSRDAGLTQIRRAFRRLSLRFHPDVTGEEHADQYDRVREAFETLSHTARRADYDRQLVTAEQTRTLADEITPLFPHAIDVMRDFGTVRPGTDEVLAHVLSNFTGRAPKSHPTRELNIEITLTPDQAKQGGRVAVAVPVARVCSCCGGTGRSGFFACDACAGHGTTWQKATVDIPIPQNAQPDTTLETSLSHLGIHNMWLKTHLRITTPPAA
jgi:molecular chaperone DnaJ